MCPDAEKAGAGSLPAGGEAGVIEEGNGAAEVPELHALPKDIGVVLLSAGVIGFVMPGPGTPAIIAGGLVLWPKRFGKAEVWFRGRIPSAHREGMRQVQRFLADLERRYPGSLR